MRVVPADVWSDLKRNAVWAALAGLLGALLFYPFDLWFLAPLALVPLLLALRRTESVRSAGYLGLLFGWVLGLVSLQWLWSIFSTGAVAVCVLIALPWLLFGLAYRLVCDRLPPAWLVIATPVLFTACEWVRCQGWYFRFSWLQLGSCYVASQASQSTYPLLGIYGMTFLTVLVNAVFAAALVLPTRRRRLCGLVCAAALVAALAVVFRVAWLAELHRLLDNSGGRGTGVLMVQSETEDLDWLIAETRSYARARPQLIVWPELAVNDYVESDQGTLARLGELARTMRATVVLGCKSHVPPGTTTDWLRRRAMLQAAGELYYNSALVIGPDGRVVGRYHKRHPIQFFADGVPGPGYPVFPAPFGRLGLAICYDLDFADTALSLTRNGAQLLVVPTYDARDWGAVQQRQHARLALARAAEVGRCVVRPTSSGVSQIIAPGGEQVISIASGEASHRLGVVSPRDDLTPYVRGVWLLPLVCVGLSVVLVVACLCLPQRGRASWGCAR